MSITQKQTSEYVAQYYKDRYGLISSGDEMLKKYPWHEIVWETFFAYAYYKVKDYYENWDDVPGPELDTGGIVYQGEVSRKDNKELSNLLIGNFTIKR